jgi:non-ribosomal peptide synthetase component F
LSFSQQRLWFYEQLEPNSALYNSTVSIEISGPLEVDLFSRAIYEIVRRHEALRTVFVMVAGEGFQSILPELSVPVQHHDLQGLEQSKQQKEVARISSEEAQLPYDLSRGPLIRVRLLQLGVEKFVAFLSIHHIVSDGWSFGILVKELESFYNAYQFEQVSPLRDLVVQYVDFCYWQRQQLQGEYLESLVDYWRGKLHHIPAEINLPADHIRPPAFSFRGASYHFTIPEPLSLALRDFSQQESVTFYMTLLAGFQLLLHRYSGQDDFGVGTPIANRTRAELEPIIGLFINMLVIRVNMAGNPVFREFLQRVKMTLLEAYAHQDLNFEILVERLHPKRLANRSPFFQVMFILENIPINSLQIPGLEISMADVDTRTSKYDLSLYVSENGRDGLACRLEYATDLFEAGTIQRMATHYCALLEEIVARPEQPIAEIGKVLFSEFSRRQDGFSAAISEQDREEFEV